MRKFPIVKGSNLEGKKYVLPGDLEGQLNIVMIPFLRQQQYSVNQWAALLTELQKEYPFIEFYELPTLAKGYKAMRFMIDGGMRAGIPSIETRNRTITVYINKSKFKKKLGISTEQQIYVYALEGDSILWSEAGNITTAKADSLRSFVEDYSKKQ